MGDMVATVTVIEMTRGRATGLPRGAKRADLQLTGINGHGRGPNRIGAQTRELAARAAIGVRASTNDLMRRNEASQRRVFA